MREQYSDGYALAWVIIIMMILFLFVSAAMSFAAGSYARTQADHSKKQAALTARTLAQVLAEDFVNHSDQKGGFAERILSQLEQETEDVISTEALQVEGLAPSLGICTVEAVYHRDIRIMTLTIKCILNDEKEIVSVNLLDEIPNDYEDGADEGETWDDSDMGSGDDTIGESGRSKFTDNWKIMGYQEGDE